MSNTQYKKVVLYVDEKKYRTLRSILAKVAKSASEWLREQIDVEIEKSDNSQ